LGSEWVRASRWSIVIRAAELQLMGAAVTWPACTTLTSPFQLLPLEVTARRIRGTGVVIKAVGFGQGLK
jgi:hypothetical protein